MGRRIIRKKGDNRPFMTEYAAKSAIVKAGENMNDYDIVPEDGGFIAVARNETPDQPNENPKPAARPKRVPIGRRDVLKYSKRPGYVRRVVNDEYDRVQMFIDAGYEPVVGHETGTTTRGQDASQLGSTVSRPVGGGMKGVLMEIPEDLYKEYQEAKDEGVDELELSMRRNIKGRTNDGDYGYVKIQ